MKSELTVGLIILTVTVFGQGVGNKYDFDKYKSIRLNPTPFEVESTPTLIYVKKNAEIYFKQSDIKEYIQSNSLDSADKVMTIELLKLINEEKKIIEIVDLLFEVWTAKEADSVNRKRLTVHYSKLTNHLIESIGADLIYEGKFMVFDPKRNQFVEKGLKGKRHQGKIGSNTFDYYLPDKRKFYSIITALVE